MATYYEYDCGNGFIWRIPLEEEKIEKRKIRVIRPHLTEAQEAAKMMREIYAAQGIPVPQWEEDFAQGMIEAEGAPPEAPSSESEKEEVIPPMPAYGTQEFFMWCRKTKKAREEKKAREVAAKEAAKAAKTAAKEAAKAAKVAEKEAKAAKKAPAAVKPPPDTQPKPKVKPRIKVKETV